MWYFLKLWCLFHTFVALILGAYYYLGNPSVQDDFIRTLPTTVAIIIGLEALFLILLRQAGIINKSKAHTTIPPIPKTSDWRSVVKDFKDSHIRQDEPRTFTRADYRRIQEVNDTRSPVN